MSYTDTIRKRIRKLVRLAKSTTSANEAEVAQAEAERLASEHDVDVEEVDSETTILQIDDKTGLPRENLAQAIAVSRGIRMQVSRRGIRIAGPDHAVQDAARHYAQCVARAIAKCSPPYGSRMVTDHGFWSRRVDYTEADRTGYIDAFWCGFVDAVVQNLREAPPPPSMAETAETSMPSASPVNTAPEPFVRETQQELNSRVRQAVNVSARDAYQEGFAAGIGVFLPTYRKPPKRPKRIPASKRLMAKSTLPASRKPLKRAQMRPGDVR